MYVYSRAGLFASNEVVFRSLLLKKCRARVQPVLTVPMGPPGGRGTGRGDRADDTVIISGQTLKRVLDADTKQWVYRPIDARSGETVSREAFEAAKREAREARLENDPRVIVDREKRWAAAQRAEIREMRAQDERKTRRERVKGAKKEPGGASANAARRKKPIATVKPPTALLNIREEMRIANANDLSKKNPKSYAFVKSALDAEEAKHDANVKAAREKAYQRERTRRGVRGAAWGDSESGEDDGFASEEETGVGIRGSLADLDDPDYRRSSLPPVAGDSGGGAYPEPRGVGDGDGNDGGGGERGRGCGRGRGGRGMSGRGGRVDLSEAMRGTIVNAGGDGGGRGRGRGRVRGRGRGAPSVALFEP